MHKRRNLLLALAFTPFLMGAGGHYVPPNTEDTANTSRAIAAMVLVNPNPSGPSPWQAKIWLVYNGSSAEAVFPVVPGFVSKLAPGLGCRLIANVDQNGAPTLPYDLTQNRFERAMHEWVPGAKLKSLFAGINISIGSPPKSDIDAGVPVLGYIRAASCNVLSFGALSSLEEVPAALKMQPVPEVLLFSANVWFLEKK